MKIAVLGTGPVGLAIASRLMEQGHTVVLGTRDPDVTSAREAEVAADGTSTSYAVWTAQHGMSLAAFDAAAQAELVINASGGQVTLAVLSQAGEENLAGKVIVDLSNPLDFSDGFPPRLFVADTDSLAEQIQRAHPTARVVKAFNTMAHAVMTHPAQLPAETTAFVAGDDADAKAMVAGILASFGHTDVIDFGDITAARGLEMYLGFWTRLYAAVGTADFNIKVVR